MTRTTKSTTQLPGGLRALRFLSFIVGLAVVKIWIGQQYSLEVWEFIWAYIIMIAIWGIVWGVLPRVFHTYGFKWPLVFGGSFIAAAIAGVYTT